MTHREKNSTPYHSGYKETEQAIQAARVRDLERRYRRLVAQMRLRRVAPWLFGAAMAVVAYWMVKFYLLMWG